MSTTHFRSPLKAKILTHNHTQFLSRSGSEWVLEGEVYKRGGPEEGFSLSSWYARSERCKFPIEVPSKYEGFLFILNSYKHNIANDGTTSTSSLRL